MKGGDACFVADKGRCGKWFGSGPSLGLFCRWYQKCTHDFVLCHSLSNYKWVFYNLFFPMIKKLSLLYYQLIGTKLKYVKGVNACYPAFEISSWKAC